jgi:asparagine synthase (glutamine-hydrolysing)
MCGIAGVVNHNNEAILKKLRLALLHRGPDAQDDYTHNNISLIHTRLAIQDIKNGQQPFHLENCSIIFNGQIYNHLELRKQHLPEVHFRTQSDTETLLAMYLKFSTDMFQYLEGMFAFAILDQNKNQLLLARDRAGKKPLYYYQKAQVFAFASELNALKGAFACTINHEAITSALRCGLYFKEHTPYQEITTLTAGTYLILNIAELDIKQEHYFNLLDYYQQPKLALPLTEAITQVEHSLQKAITARLLSSELEVGAFLSGGIDSGLIVAMASAIQPKIKTFTVKFSGNYDESHLAKLTAQHYHTEHHELEIAMHVAEDLEKILLNYGEPFVDSSAIPSYYVAKAAKEHVTVVLNGDGADELFGGYRRYVPLAHHWIKYAKHFSKFTTLLPKPRHKQSKYTYLYRLLSMAKKQGLDFQTSSIQDSFDDCYKFPHNNIDQEADYYIREIQNLPNLSLLDKKLYLDFSINLFGDLLVKMDIATMAHALEARSPFLAKDILTLAPRLPDQYKIHGTTTKYILRQLAKKYLPEALVNQPKRGFEVPLKSWIDHELADKIQSYLNNNACINNYINASFIQKLLNKKIATSDEKRAKMLWSLLATEIWLRHV